MNITFEPVELDTGHGDRQGLLVFTDGRLTGVLSRLDAGHGDLSGRWFLETSFREVRPSQSRTYDSPEAFSKALGSPD